MKTKLLTLFILMSTFSSLVGQEEFIQYFDGADTVCVGQDYTLSICIDIEDDTTNIWQIGVPQKPIFNSASTLPGALVTDTINSYPPDNISRFQFVIKPWINWGILALHWMQKLDMDQRFDGGTIEFSNDLGVTWENAFNNPYVYNFYGYEIANADTLPSGDYCFSGADSLWRDVWLCYDMSWVHEEGLHVRYTFSSDSLDNNREGWLIDNLLAHITINHTVGEKKQEQYLNVYPNPATDIIYIQTQKLQEFHIIESMILYNTSGQVVDEWKTLPTKFFIDTKKYNTGMYYLYVQTNIKSETVPIMITHN